MQDEQKLDDTVKYLVIFDYTLSLQPAGSSVTYCIDKEELARALIHFDPDSYRVFEVGKEITDQIESVSRSFAVKMKGEKAINYHLNKETKMDYEVICPECGDYTILTGPKDLVVGIELDDECDHCAYVGEMVITEVLE